MTTNRQEAKETRELNTNRLTRQRGTPGQDTSGWRDPIGRHEPRHRSPPGMTPGRGHRPPPENGLIFCQYSNLELAAQNAALREQLRFQHHRYDHERQRLLRALKKPGESDPENIVAAVDKAWQRRWAAREQEAAAQFQSHREGVQRYVDDMALHFHSQLEILHVHNVDTVCYFQGEMEYMQWHMGRAISEKDELVQNLKKENSVLVAENKAMSSQLCKFNADTPEPENAREEDDRSQAERQGETSPAVDELREQVEMLGDTFKSLAVREEELQVLEADW
ncbi:uncharacterized protein LOC133417024 isoform X1 [Phycodurus eques]|uniref:uncharacterized protein LOC133417024 isoform X1 n=1 Tax=Phycodurus eques TaxID=693459 RepID=UPI002ACE0D47|nr:uncharacterized protein LOC133417024 isoform X1 [Phycodurus eques]